MLLVPAAVIGGCPVDPHPRACVPGQRACPCTVLGACDDGIVCDEHQCLEPHVASVHVSLPGARACEALFESGGSKLADVSFGSSARGALARRGQQVGVSMISAADADLTGHGIEVRWLGSGTRPDITVVSSECFDRAGASIPEARVELR